MHVDLSLKDEKIYMKEVVKMKWDIEKICNEVWKYYGVMLKEEPYDMYKYGKRWYAKKGKSEVSIHFSEYSADIDETKHKGTEFIGVDISEPGSGMGAPCDSTEEVIETLIKYMCLHGFKKKEIIQQTLFD